MGHDKPVLVRSSFKLCGVFPGVDTVDFATFKPLLCSVVGSVIDDRDRVIQRGATACAIWPAPKITMGSLICRGSIYTSISPPQHIPRSLVRCTLTLSGWPSTAARCANSITRYSKMPPPTVPMVSPSANTSILAPLERGAEPLTEITVAIAALVPVRIASAAAANSLTAAS